MAIQQGYAQIATGACEAISIQFRVPNFGLGAVGVAVEFISQQVSSYQDSVNQGLLWGHSVPHYRASSGSTQKLAR